MLWSKKPPEDEAVLLCVRCWHALSSERQIVSGAVGSIPWRAVNEWGIEHGLDRESRQLLHAVIDHVEHERIRKLNAHAALKNATGGRS